MNRDSTKRGRPPTGCPKWNQERGYWEARVTIPRTTRREPVPMRGIAEGDVARAQAVARIISARVQRDGFVPAETAETLNEWAVRWLDARTERGLASVRQDRGRFNKWISPVLGTRPVADVTRRDLEGFVEQLDADVRAGKLAWKTAINTWGVVSKMFSDACRSKRLDLRVRDDNPARDVQGPDRGADRVGPYLFPREFGAIMRCARVPMRWKRLIALSTYLYVRRGELAAIDIASVNVEQGYVHVHQAENEAGAIKSTKTEDNRRVPIEPTLVPMLRAMKSEATTGRLVAAMPPRESLAERLRKYVQFACEDAGIPVREELLADDETRRPLSWHDLRHTGVTWRAVRGDPPKKIQRAAGHSDSRTTDIYINEAEVFDLAAFGQVFAPLPDDLGDGGPIFGSNSAILDRWEPVLPRKPAEIGRPQGDSNPR